MKHSKGEVLTKIAHAILVFGLIVLVAEVHFLRAEVSSLERTSMGGDEQIDRIATSLDRPLADLAKRMSALALALDRRPLVGAVSATADRDSKVAIQPSAVHDSVHPVVDRVPIAAVDWQARLDSIVTTIENLGASPRVRGASLPGSRASAREIQVGAVSKTIAAMARSPERRSRFLMMTPKQILERYGQPTSITFGEKDEREQVRWWYELENKSELSFILYDGRVVRMESHERR